MSEITEIVTNFLIDEFSLSSNEKIDPNANLLQLGLDSLKLLRLVSFLENKFNITIDDGDINPESLSTVNKICDLIKYSSAIGV